MLKISYAQEKPFLTLENDDGGSRIGTVLFYPDESKIIVSSFTFTLFDLENGELIRRYDVGASAGSIALSPDLSQFATATGHRLIRLWDIETGHIIQEFIRNYRSLYPIAFSAIDFTPDGKNLIAVADNGEVDIWNISNGEYLILGNSPSQNLQFFDDGERVLIGAQVFSLFTGNILFYLSSHSGFKLSLDSNNLFIINKGGSSSNEFSLSVLDASDYTLTNEYLPFKKNIKKLELSPTGNFIAVQEEIGRVSTTCLIETRTGNVDRIFLDSSGKNIQPRSFKFSPSGQKLAVMEGNTVYLYNLRGSNSSVHDALLHHN